MQVAARRGLKKAAVTLWQTGVRSLFRFVARKSDWTLEYTWEVVEVELKKRSTGNAKQRHWILVRKVLMNQHDITLQEAKDLHDHFPDRTPLIDVLRDLM